MEDKNSYEERQHKELMNMAAINLTISNNHFERQCLNAPTKISGFS